MDTTPVIIIGTGLAGYTLAREFRKLDKTTPLTLISRDDGAAYSKPLLSTALTQNKMASALATSSAEAMSIQLNAQVLPHTQVNEIDSQNKSITTAAGTKLSYTKLVLALGAHQVLPPLEGDGVADIITINDLADYASFRDKLEQAKNIAIIGAGFIGCEFANDLANKNYNVDIISRGTEPFDHLLPKEIGQSLRLALEKLTTTWHCNCSANRIDHSESGYKIQLSNNSHIEASLVLSATGLKANTQLALAAGINTQRGIIANTLLETNISDIYTLGDCLELNGSVLPFIMPLMNQARALAKTLTGNDTPLSYPIMPLAVKTPSQPITGVLPKTEIDGQWQIETNVSDVKALFFDSAKQLHGFALSGSNAVKEKASLVKQLV